MLPFLTTIFIANEYAVYRLSATDDTFDANLEYYPHETQFVPDNIRFWKEGTVWKTKNLFHQEIATQLGTIMDIYHHKCLPWEEVSQHSLEMESHFA